VEHIKLHAELSGEEDMVEFTFPAKSSVRLYKKALMEKQVDQDESLIHIRNQLDLGLRTLGMRDPGNYF